MPGYTLVYSPPSPGLAKLARLRRAPGLVTRLLPGVITESCTLGYKVYRVFITCPMCNV